MHGDCTFLTFIFEELLSDFNSAPGISPALLLQSFCGMMCIIYEEMSEELTVNIKSDRHLSRSLPSDMNTCDPVMVIIKTWSYSAGQTVPGLVIDRNRESRSMLSKKMDWVYHHRTIISNNEVQGSNSRSDSPTRCWAFSFIQQLVMVHFFKRSSSVPRVSVFPITAIGHWGTVCITLPGCAHPVKFHFLVGNGYYSILQLDI